MPNILIEEPKALPAEARRSTNESHGDTWAIVLAGGEGSRLREWTLAARGQSVPKQFCAFRPGRTLLGATIDRARRIVEPDHILVVVRDSHRAWWEPEVQDLPAGNVLSQPSARGTGAAILHALVHAMVRDRAPLALVMPSDHDADDESIFCGAMSEALDEVRRRPENPVVLGMKPQSADPDYGWIVMAGPNGGVARQVLSIVEKPAVAAAGRLMQWGALWNSFVLAASASALLRLYEDTQPTLVESYFQAVAWTHGKPNALQRIFRMLPERDFVNDVLLKEAQRLKALPVAECGWTDLGTPERANAWLERHGESPLLRGARRAARRAAAAYGDLAHNN